MRGLNLKSLDADLVSNARRDTLKKIALLGMTAMLSGMTSAYAAVNVDAKRRIVSIGGALTEIVYTLGAAGDLVGVDTTSLYPEIAQKLPSVGYARALSLEGVLALAPTQVIATEDAGPPAVLRQIMDAGVPVSILAANHRFEGVLERVRLMGELTGQSQQAHCLSVLLNQGWERAQKQVSAQKINFRRVLFILAHSTNQIMVAGADTSADAMIRYAGAINAVTGFTGFKPITPEAVIAAQPDIILLTDQGMQASGGIEGALKLPGVDRTPAGKSRRIVSQEAMFMLGFGPRFPAAVEALNALLVRAISA